MAEQKRLPGRPRLHDPTDRARTIRIHNDLWNALDEIAAGKYISTNQLIHVALSEWIQQSVGESHRGTRHLHLPNKERQ
jgi:hypothetical protein